MSAAGDSYYNAFTEGFLKTLKYEVAYLGDYQFLISDLEQWDEETKPIRAGLVFSNQDLRSLSARQVMALRARTAQA